MTSLILPFDPLEHYRLNTGPTDEFGEALETAPDVKNIGWTLGNDCPYRCTHCYSMNAREKGMDLTTGMIDRIVDQLALAGIETVNLGGNEPLFTNGPNPKDTLLPYIIRSLRDRGIIVGLTTSGITAVWLHKHDLDAFRLLNDCDVSFDSPFEEEHNRNRGASIFRQAVEALELCETEQLPRTCIMAAMNWNFSPKHIEALVLLARSHDANVRINPLKPTQPVHMDSILTAQQYYEGFALLQRLCSAVDLGEPPLAAAVGYQDAKRCPCGRTSFRIHSITPTGGVYVSPCVYLHDYKSEYDLLEHDLLDIIASPQFAVFRQRNANPDMLSDCAGCQHEQTCGGGCAARSYLHTLHEKGKRTMLAKDPYCPRDKSNGVSFPAIPHLDSHERLVHMDYLCTWIGRPHEMAVQEAV